MMQNGRIIEFFARTPEFESIKGLRSPKSDSDVPTLLDYKDFNYGNCSLIDCISLLQSVLNSPHAYSQNKTYH